jgi:hypothetical protein
MEEYNYKNLPITPAIIEELAVKLLNKTLNKRDAIVNKVLNYHISNGGRPPEAQDFSRSVKKALSNMVDKGWASNQSYGYWNIHREDSDIVCPEVECDVVTQIEDIPTHTTYGLGNYAVYFYYFDGSVKFLL